MKALAPDELVARVAAGTLEELEGIGPKTAAIITEVATSGSTVYLDKLEDETALTVGKGNELVAQLKGDLLQQLDIVAALNQVLAPFRILTGIEVDILEEPRPTRPSATCPSRRGAARRPRSRATRSHRSSPTRR